MKIVHLCLGNYFIDGYSYQENNLVKHHKRMGNEVEVIASLQNYDAKGNVVYNLKPGSYYDDSGNKITRLRYRFPKKLAQKIKMFRGLYAALESARPDFIFIHNPQFCEIYPVIRYLTLHPMVRAVADSHVDRSNSGRNWFSYNFLHKGLWRWTANKLNPYLEKFYGVLPARVDFLRDVYKLPADKCDLLVMGADEELVHKAALQDSKVQLRKKYNIKDTDFLIVTGGKIDLFKTETLSLMRAVNLIADDNIKLIVFGSVVDELKEDFINSLNGNKVQYAGWIKSEESYQYFGAADLAIFPGRHSVFWEQVVAQGIPMICKAWEGTKHVDLGGNVQFLLNSSEEEIKNKILEIYNNPVMYAKMKQIALTKGMKEFSYTDIARRCIE